MWLDDNQFRMVIEHTPLVSLDFAVQSVDGQLLLGERLNRPAKGYWFVPGGRVRKGETISKAFERLTEQEFSLRFPLSAGKFLGAFEHFYEDSVFGSCDGGTHYIVLAYLINIYDRKDFVPGDKQHRNFGWWHADAIRDASNVHPYTKSYLEYL